MAWLWASPSTKIQYIPLPLDTLPLKVENVDEGILVEGVEEKVVEVEEAIMFMPSTRCSNLSASDRAYQDERSPPVPMCTCRLVMQWICVIALIISGLHLFTVQPKKAGFRWKTTGEAIRYDDGTASPTDARNNYSIAESSTTGARNNRTIAESSLIGERNNSSIAESIAGTASRRANKHEREFMPGLGWL
mmetsp:Transcript_12240/g.20641  ORF Transcript_12240/g.20641 Transcript_12240/m.20641 type:complete len:191 (-) Transcript_12240:414-986(-)|eukprot:CAMPEP_0119299786 /NCGR_PEP_ID=MMETSP1333-20130426/1819_1 /TAXON_ID=418940 /ORGANISM="Scyphosphaera apsteinii, Strain RCC1455" /LENGTH=190 /DNA_ID=CAMNT_0007301335 /DNA_START=36 /DNA_END=608 /DNA_ORIENTATION=-